MTRRLLALALLLPLVAGCGETEPPKDQVPSIVLGVGSDNEAFDNCPPATVERLKEQDLAFAGTVTASDGETSWTFEVDEWYAGGSSREAVLEGGDAGLHYLWKTIGKPGEKGAKFLVAGVRPLPEFDDANDDVEVFQVTACLSRPWSEKLAKTYEDAF